MLFVLNSNGVPSVAKIIQRTSSNVGPTLNSLSPSSASAGGPAFTLTVHSSNFVSGAVVQWNGAAHTTTFVSTTQLTAAPNESSNEWHNGWCADEGVWGSRVFARCRPWQTEHRHIQERIRHLGCPSP